MTHGGATPEKKKRPRKGHHGRISGGIEKPAVTDPNSGATSASPPGQAFDPRPGHRHHHRPKPDKS